MLMSRVDHCGNLAYLNSNNGFNGRILGTNQTLEVAKELKIDSSTKRAFIVKWAGIEGLSTDEIFSSEDE